MGTRAKVTEDGLGEVPSPSARSGLEGDRLAARWAANRSWCQSWVVELGGCGGRWWEVGGGRSRSEDRGQGGKEQWLVGGTCRLAPGACHLQVHSEACPLETQ